MHVEGQFTVRAAQAQVYAFFSDPRQLLDCLDDPHTVDTAQGDQFAGTITTGVAFIRGTFRFNGRYTARTPANTSRPGSGGTASAARSTLRSRPTSPLPGRGPRRSGRPTSC